MKSIKLAIMVVAMFATTSAFAAPFQQLAQDDMGNALQHLMQARSALQNGKQKSGHRAKALQAVQAAIAHVKAAQAKNKDKPIQLKVDPNHQTY